MSASLVGSEMCIRDRVAVVVVVVVVMVVVVVIETSGARQLWRSKPSRNCLLYTSDAADDM
eukprot:6867985-Alexandrium_andersonii.AAC.1